MIDILITECHCSLTCHAVQADMPAKCNAFPRCLAPNLAARCLSRLHVYGRPSTTECDMHYARGSVMECDYHGYVYK